MSEKLERESNNNNNNNNGVVAQCGNASAQCSHATAGGRQHGDQRDPSSGIQTSGEAREITGAH